MGKVPRKWTEWTVKLAKNRQPKIESAVIYIGAEVVTYACAAQESQRPELGAKASTTIKPEAKKRLGSRRYTSSLTQSLTLSHANKILHILNSSVELAIILPATRFTRVKLAAPTELSPSDLAPTLRWAIQQQGFSPLEDWLWDAISHPEINAGQAHWEVVLLPASVADNYLQRLGIKQARLARLVPDDQTVLSNVPLPMGPWLDESQAQLALSYLDQQMPLLLADKPKTSRGIQPSPTRLNLAYNLISQTASNYYRALIQCALMIGAIILAGAAWWTQQTALTSLANNATASQDIVPEIPSQPLQQHTQLWQALYALDGEEVSIQHLEYLRGRWLLQIETFSPNAAAEWILRLDEELSSLRANASTGAGIKPWKVINNASRSRQGTTIFDVEVVQ